MVVLFIAKSVINAAKLDDLNGFTSTFPLILYIQL